MGARISPRGFRRLLLLGCVLLGDSPNAPAVTDELLCKIVTVRVGGIVVPGPWSTNTSGVMSVHLSRPARIEISYAPVDSASNQPLRLLRKLDGWDKQWQEAGGQMQRAEMQLMLMIHDASNQVLSHQRFTMRDGESEGWGGDLERSDFRPRSESISLPVGADRLQVLLTAENWTVLGCAAITDFRIWRRDPNGQEENIWPDPNLEEGENLDRPEGTPRHWQRSSFGRRMAQVMPLRSPATGHALVIKDDDVRMSATWQSELSIRERAQPGDKLSVEWREAFSVGVGERSRATIDPLPPGQYVFRIKTVTPFGEPIGRELALNIIVPQALWKRPGFFIPAVLGLAAALATLVWFVVNRRLQRQLIELEHRRQVAQERLRIAQDIHDDLGASLTHINLVSQTVHERLQHHQPALQETKRLRALAVLLTQKLDEIVWAVSPQHDNLDSLLSYLTDFAEDFLEAAGIRARIQIPAHVPDWILPSSLRHNVFLAAKETLNNAVKHSQAKEIHLRLAITDQAFELTIEDNGRGFTLPAPSQSAPRISGRHGLSGIRSRMASVGGTFRLESAPAQGTRVTLTVPVKESDA